MRFTFETDNIDDALNCINGQAYYNSLVDMNNYLDQAIEHTTDKDEKERVQLCKDALIAIVQAQGVNISWQ